MNDLVFFVGGYYVQLAAMCTLVYKIRRTKSIHGLSWDTQLCVLIASVCKLAWVPDTRLFESVFTFLELGLSPVAAALSCYLCYKLIHTSYEGDIPFYFRVWLEEFCSCFM